MVLAQEQSASRRNAFAAFMDLDAKFELHAFYWARSLVGSVTAENYYVRHLTDDEVAQFLAHAGLELPERRYPFRADDTGLAVSDIAGPNEQQG